MVDAKLDVFNDSVPVCLKLLFKYDYVANDGLIVFNESNCVRHKIISETRLNMFKTSLLCFAPLFSNQPY